MNLNHFIVADDIGDSLADALRVYVVEIGYLCIVSISSSLLKQQVSSSTEMCNLFILSVVNNLFGEAIHNIILCLGILLNSR